MTSAWIPGVVFPESENSARAQRFPDVIHGRCAFRWRDVMEHTIAVNEVLRFFGLVIADAAELRARAGMVGASQIEQILGGINAQNKALFRQRQKQRR